METSQSRPVGVLGAGRMGLPIIGHLVSAGFPVVVYDVDPAKRETVTGKGAAFATDIGAVADCGTVLVCVGYEEQLHAIMLGEGGLLGRLADGTVVAVLSTVSPEVMKRLSAAASPYGVDVVDAPVCRGSWAADAGQLLSLLGRTWRRRRASGCRKAP
jgi:3-hydroxyisobutyrate dehydrogenase